MRFRLSALVIAASLATTGTLLARQQSAQPSPLKRTVLQTHALSVPGREGVQTLAELTVGGTAPRHTHPGEEFGYVLEGTATLDIAGQPQQSLKAGDPFFIPANTAHQVRNTGAIPFRLIGTYFNESGKPLSTPAP